jgi:hypothetical protein
MLRKFFFRLSSSQTIFGNLLSFKEILGKNPMLFNFPIWIFVFSNLEDFIRGRSDGSIGGLRHNLGLDPAGIVLPDHLNKQHCIPINCTSSTVFRINTTSTTEFRINCTSSTVFRINRTCSTVFRINYTSSTVFRVTCISINVFRINCTSSTLFRINCTSSTVFRINCTCSIVFRNPAQSGLCKVSFHFQKFKTKVKRLQSFHQYCGSRFFEYQL